MGQSASAEETSQWEAATDTNGAALYSHSHPHTQAMGLISTPITMASAPAAVGSPVPAPVSSLSLPLPSPPPSAVALPPLAAHTTSDTTIAYLTRRITEAEANAAANPSSSAPDLFMLRHQLRMLTDLQLSGAERQRVQDELRVQQLLHQFAQPTRSPPTVATAVANTLPTAVHAAGIAPPVAAPLIKKPRPDGSADPHPRALPAYADTNGAATAALVIARQPEVRIPLPTRIPPRTTKGRRPRASPPPAHLPASGQLHANNTSGLYTQGMPAPAVSPSDVISVPSPAGIAMPPDGTAVPSPDSTSSTCLADFSFAVAPAEPWVAHVEREAAPHFADDLIDGWQGQTGIDESGPFYTEVNEMGHPFPAAASMLPLPSSLLDALPAAAPWTPSDWLRDEQHVGSEAYDTFGAFHSTMDSLAASRSAIYRESAGDVVHDRSFNDSNDSDSDDAHKPDDDTDRLDPTETTGHVSPHAAARDRRRMLAGDILERLESGLRTGQLSPNAVRHSLIWFSHSMQPEETSELTAHFERMNLSACESALRSSEPTVGLGVCTVDPATASVADLLTRYSVRDRGFGLSPLETAPDDADLVARVRMTRLTAKDARRKRKLVDRPLPPSVAESTGTYAAADSIADAEYCLIFQVNHAYERLTGFTQAELVAIVNERGFTGLMACMMRSDHLYQVRLRKDGSEFYCLEHLKVHCEGKFRTLTVSYLPLPNDPAHPPPPFVEGVDIDEATLRHGYKPAETRAIDSASSSSESIQS